MQLPSEPHPAVPQLGCRTCGITEQVPPHDLRHRVLAFFDAHTGKAHQAWIDLAGGAIAPPAAGQPPPASL